MKKLLIIRAVVNREKRDMLKRGTSYRKKTVIYASRLINELISSNYSSDVTREQLILLVKENFNADDERAYDVAKYLHIHLRSMDDRARLASYYQEAEERLKSINLIVQDV